jgi:hypothetical protein
MKVLVFRAAVLSHIMTLPLISALHRLRIMRTFFLLLGRKEYKMKYVVFSEDDGFVARGLDVEVASDGTTEQEAVANLHEALELYFEDHETVDWRGATGFNGWCWACRDLHSCSMAGRRSAGTVSGGCHIAAVRE